MFSEQNPENGGYVSHFPLYQITNVCDQSAMSRNSTDEQTRCHIFLLLVCLAVFIMSCLQSNLAEIFVWFSKDFIPDFGHRFDAIISISLFHLSHK